MSSFPCAKRVETVIVWEGGRVRKYFSSPEPRARDKGMRWTRTVVDMTPVLVVRSQIGKQFWVMPERGWKGLLYVRSVMGRSASEMMLRDRVGGMGLE